MGERMNPLELAQLMASRLDPASIKIDGRNTRDLLAFVAKFAKLVLYYDQNNQASGDWQLFFLKDPAILLAAISKTDYLLFHAQFVQIDARFKKIFAESANNTANTANVVLSQELFDLLNRLCILLQEIFVLLNQWFQIMQRHALDISLHDFLALKIKDGLSGQLWQMVRLQRSLSLASSGRIGLPADNVYSAFEPAWKHGQNVSVDPKLTTVQKAEALCMIYLAVFDVMMQIIDYAKEAFYQLDADGNDYPDTALLIAFCQLMQIQQTEINQYSKKHLDFYYDRVLQQTLLPAKPDQTIICLTLADGVATLDLPLGTAFAAGNYPDEQPIVFVNPKPTAMNRIAIASANTLYFSKFTAPAPLPAPLPGLYLGTILTPSLVVRNQLQEIQSWDAFGNTAGQLQQQGFALASPMLFLQGGTRSITITLDFKDSVQTKQAQLEALFLNSQFFLSTEAAWLDVSHSPLEPGGKTWTCSDASIAITLGLPVSVDPIVAFADNPDGFVSVWPMFKVLLAATADLTRPPILSKVTIDVDVDKFDQFTFANDTSLLPTTGPMLIFGPTPEVGSQFYVGSNECFAKPLTTLTLHMKWDNLPKWFDQYYGEYNTYLLQQTPPRVAEFSNTAFSGSWQMLYGRAWHPLPVTLANQTQVEEIQLFQQCESGGTCETDDTCTIGENLPDSLFYFDPLPLLASYPASPTLALAPLPAVELAQNGYIRLGLNQPGDAFGNNLYAQVLSYIALENAQYLIDQAKPGDQPSDQPSDKPGDKPCSLGKIAKSIKNGLKSLWRKISGSKTSTANPAIASASVAATAPPTAFSAGKLDQHEADGPEDDPSGEDTDGLLDMPSPPWAPLQSALTGHYIAQSVCPVSTSQSANYPLELYHYGSFKNYLAYDATAGKPGGLGFLNLVPKAGVSDLDTASLALFPGVSGPGCLYLELAEVVAPCTLSLFAKVVNDGVQADGSNSTVGYFYWTSTGWRELVCLQDDTMQLTCSGILILEIPQSPAVQRDQHDQHDQEDQDLLTYTPSPIMPGENFWLAVATGERDIVVKLSYLNTQACSLRRLDLLSLPKGDVPQIAANTISAAPDTQPTIAQVVQPFASFGGLAAESRDSYVGPNSFYRRVSERIGNKDRASSPDNYVAMAHEACPGLFYVKVLTPLPTQTGNRPGTVRLGLVQHYPDAGQPNAFRPVVSGNDQVALQTFLAARASAMATIKVENLLHQPVWIQARLVLASQTNVNAVYLALNQGLNLYLSPWISSVLPQMDIAQGLDCAGLVNFLSGWPEVVDVADLAIWLTEPTQGGAPVTDNPVLATLSNAILVSGMQHDLSFIVNGASVKVAKPLPEIAAGVP
jgi:Baseplate J-like protein